MATITITIKDRLSLRAALTAAGETVGSVAKHAGVSSSHVSNVLTGRKRSVGVAQAICSVTNLPRSLIDSILASPPEA